MYSSSPEATKVKTTPLEKMKSFLGKFTSALFASVNVSDSTNQYELTHSHDCFDDWGGGVCGGDNS
jgi:hypothetical protein